MNDPSLRPSVVVVVGGTPVAAIVVECIVVAVADYLRETACQVFAENLDLAQTAAISYAAVVAVIGLDPVEVA